MKIDVEKIEEAYAQLPENLQDFLDSKEAAVTINDIGKKYSLHIDQLGQLAIVVRAILSGVVSRQNSLNQLREETGLPEDTLNLIIYDLNQQIFSKIREQLQQRPQEMPTMSAPPAKEVQTPTPTSSPQQTFQEKMGGISNVPKQEVEVETKTGDNETKEVEKKPARDPYREPIN